MDKTKEELGKDFVKNLNKLGIKDIQTIPEGCDAVKKEHTEVWVIKG